jgi:hypothetical protein
MARGKARMPFFIPDHLLLHCYYIITVHKIHSIKELHITYFLIHSYIHTYIHDTYMYIHVYIHSYNIEKIISKIILSRFVQNINFFHINSRPVLVIIV